MLGLLQLEAPGIVGGKNLPRRPGDDVVRPISQQRLPHRQSRDRLRRSALALPVRNAERVIEGPQPTALGDGLQSRKLHVLPRFAAFVALGDEGNIVLGLRPPPVAQLARRPPAPPPTPRPQPPDPRPP